MNDFDNKVIVVFGAAGVFGQHVARSLRERGADVRLVVRRADALPGDLRDLPFAESDITERSQVAAALGSVTRNELVDGIINCTGVVAFGTFSEMSDGVAQELMAVNAQGVFNLISLAATSISPEGFLASFSGVAADMSIAGMGVYCASKAAAKTAMAVATRELRGKKIRVLDIRAPHTETGLVNRAREGVAPKMPEGLQPQFVIDRVLEAIANGEKDLPAEAFAAPSN
jgi:cyclic-di-GMP-binding biofilm dispersal mediator protein